MEPRRHPEVAVLFCDVAGFTAYCDEHPPETVVAQLQHLVEVFEELAVATGWRRSRRWATRSWRRAVCCCLTRTRSWRRSPAPLP